MVVTGKDSLSLYVNGTLVASSTTIKTSYYQTYSGQRFTLTIGNPKLKKNNGNSHLSMCDTSQIREESNNTVIGVDDLRFYSRELKVKEIQALANDDHFPTKHFFD